MNESETRAEHIDPALKAAGWGLLVRGSFFLKSARVALTFSSLERTLEPVEITTAVNSVTATSKESPG